MLHLHQSCLVVSRVLNLPPQLTVFCLDPRKVETSRTRESPAGSPSETQRPAGGGGSSSSSEQSHSRNGQSSTNTNSHPEVFIAPPRGCRLYYSYSNTLNSITETDSVLSTSRSRSSGDFSSCRSIKLQRGGLQRLEGPE